MRSRDRDRVIKHDVRVVHRDAHLLVLSKPKNLATTAPDASTECLATIARRMLPDAQHMHPSSRLDRDVTGLVTFALTDRAIAALLEARREGRYRRMYLALVAGEPEGERGAWEWGIAIDPRDRKLRIALETGATGERAQEARSRWEKRGIAGEARASALALFPDTGRTHQLRVHCARAGHPILGDVDYGGAARVVLGDGRVVTPRRPMLHCAMLALPDVERGGTLDLQAEVPEDVVRTWTSLSGDADALALSFERA